MSDPFLGEIKMVGFNFAPRGYATCQGQILSIAQNSALFALFGVMYGGNGTTTFGLPNYQGRSPVGMGAGPGLQPITQGEAAGVENVTLLTANLPMHTHPATGAATLVVGSVSSNPANAPSATNNVLAAAGAGQGAATIWSDNLNDPVALANAPTVTVQVGPAGANLPLNIRNPYLGTNFVVALAGEFPTRD